MCRKCLEKSYGCTTANHLTNRLEIHRLQTNIVGQLKFPESQSPGQVHSQNGILQNLIQFMILTLRRANLQHSGATGLQQLLQCGHANGGAYSGLTEGCLQIKHLIIPHPESNHRLFFFNFWFLSPGQEQSCCFSPQISWGQRDAAQQDQSFTKTRVAILPLPVPHTRPPLNSLPTHSFPLPLFVS